MMTPDETIPVAVQQKLATSISPDIQKLFGSERKAASERFLRGVLAIARDYFELQPYRERMGDYRQHRDRMQGIVDAASKLHLLLSNEPLGHMLTPYNHTQFLEDLRWIEHDARQYREELRSWRGEYEGPAPNASSWRSFIWEPVFRAMADAGVPVPKSRDGPLTRMLQNLHDTLGLPKVDGEALKQAAAAFRRRVERRGNIIRVLP